MPSEIRARYPTVATLYAHLVRCSDGAFWTGFTFGVVEAANWSLYDIAMAEVPSTGYYYADMPVVDAGLYDALILLREGALPATTDPLVAQASLRWNGAAEVAVPTAVQNADALLARTRAGGADGGRTVAECLAAGRNKVALDVPAEGQFTVFDDDDVTPLYTGAYVRDPAAVGALTVIDPG